MHPARPGVEAHRSRRIEMELEDLQQTSRAPPPFPFPEARPFHRPPAAPDPEECHVRARRRQAASIMPSDLAHLMTDQEFRDLIAFLRDRGAGR